MRTLTGVALDGDPRFPFYRLSDDIERALPGEGARIEQFLQLKTCPADVLRGRILVDSPGFDADQQRDSTLRITREILDLSDLVLVFFDARHPEPGAMRDTLEHLVRSTGVRPDAGKFVYVLNQIDATAAEDNAEDVVAAWRKALAGAGTSGGTFVSLYNPNHAVAIEDDEQQRRYAARSERGLDLVRGRMQEVGTERCYRLVAALEHAITDIERNRVPSITGWLKRWRRRVFWWEASTVAALSLAVLAVAIAFPSTRESLLGATTALPDLATAACAGSAAAIAAFAMTLAIPIGLHLQLRVRSRRSLLVQVARTEDDADRRAWIARALTRSTVWWRPMGWRRPRGWSRRRERGLRRLREASPELVQLLNDRFASPAGTRNGASAG